MVRAPALMMDCIEDELIQQVKGHLEPVLNVDCSRSLLCMVNFVQEELDDILRYGAKELFTEGDEAGKAGQIHYDDVAIERQDFPHG